MITKLSHVCIYVDDQAKALQFYKDKLGLKVHTDTDWEGMRWLTLNPQGQPDVEVVIFQATEAASKALIGKQSPEGPLFVFVTNDVKGDYERLKAQGVKFSKEPTERPWGIEALFYDPFGNLLMLNQS